jgi:DNA-directed RNA polymerase specialized sigma24 family protein
MQTQSLRQEIRFEDSTRLIQRVAYRVSRRLKSAGAHSVQIEDIKSELAIAWCHARDRFDPQLGIPFQAYLTRGMFNHINRWVQAEINCSLALDLDKGFGDDDGGDTLESVTPDESLEGADDLIIQSEFYHSLLNRLSNRSRQFVVLLASPPIELVNEHRAILARVDYAKSRGIAAIAPGRVNKTLVFEFMGANNAERCSIIREINERIKQLHGR